MAQKSKIVDVTQSYIPVDPQAFPETLGLTAKEDDPARDMTIMAYEGYNFLPTSYGYRSYFDTRTILSFDALITDCDKILSFQSKLYENALIAFCSDGVYMVKAGETAWTQIWALTDTWVADQIYSQYTWCVLENNLYIYRQGEPDVLKVADDLTYTFLNPSFLNMAGQMGIFKANGSLAFWDSENSIAWSNVFDLEDFTPSVENQVGNTIFFGVQGRIVHVQDHGDGFVIYATRSIVGVTYSNTSTAVWDAGVVTAESGVAHPGAITVGTTNQEHFAYTSTGIMKIGHYNALSRKFDSSVVLPELFDYLRESREPVYLECHAARFLYFSVVDDSYISGRTSFTDVEIPSLAVPQITVNPELFGDIITNTPTLGMFGKSAYQILYSYFRNPNAGVPENLQDTTSWVGCIQLPRIDTEAVFTPTLDFTKANISESFITEAQARTTFLETYDAGMFADEDQALRQLVDEYVNSLLKYNIDTGMLEHFPNFLAHQPSYYSNIASIDAMPLLFNWLGAIDQLREKASYYTAAWKAAVPEFPEPLVLEYYDNSTIPVDLSLFLDPVECYLPEFSSRVGVKIDDVAKTIEIRNDIHQYTHIEMDVTVAHTYEPSTGTATTYPITITMVGRVGSWSYTATSYPGPAELDDLLLNYPWFDANTGTYWGLWYKFTTGYNGDDSIEDRCMIDGYGDMIPILITNGIEIIKAELYIHRIKNGRINRRPVQLRGKAEDLVYLQTVISPRHADPAYPLDPPPENDPYYSTWIYDNHTNYLVPSVRCAGDSSWLMNNLEAYTIYEDAHHTPIPGEVGTYRKYFDIWEKEMSGPFRDGIGGYDYSKYYGGEYWETIDWAAVGYGASITAAIPAVTYKHTITVTPYVYITERKDSHTGEPWGDMSGLKALFTYNGYQDNELFPIDLSQFVQPLTDFNDYIWANVTTPSTIFDYETPEYYAGTLDITCERWDINLTTATTSQDIVSTSFMKHKEGTMVGVAMPVGPLPILIEVPACTTVDYVIPNSSGTDEWFLVTAESEFIYPGTSYTLQDGVPIPGYPTFAGALVFDTHLKKWGKYKGAHKALVEYGPINSVQNAAIPYTNFGMDSGVLTADGLIRIYAATPVDAYMRYGKIGYYRFGVSRLLEVRLHFRTKSTGRVVLDASLEGRNIDYYLRVEEAFTGTLEIILYPDIHAKWFTISIHGQFDLQYMEFRGNITSRR